MARVVGGYFNFWMSLTTASRRMVCCCSGARVLLLAGFQLVDFTGQVFVSGHKFAQPDKSTDDEDVQLYGAFAIQDR